MKKLCRWGVVVFFGVLMGMVQAQNAFTNSKGNWSTAANWNPAGNVAGSNLTFGVATIATNDFATFTNFGWVSMTANVTNRQSNSAYWYYFGNITNTGPGLSLWSINTIFTNPVTTIYNGTGRLRIAGMAITNSSTLIFDGGGAITNEDIINGAGSVTKNGAGTLIFTTTNNYSGNTTNLQGSLVLGNNMSLRNTTLVNLNTSSSNLIFNGISTPLFGGLAGSANLALTNAAGGGVTLRVGNNNSNTVYSGVLSDGGRTGVLVKVGSGTLTLNGANSYGGGTVLSNGTLSISSDANIGGASSALTFSGGLLQVTGTALQNLNTHAVNWSSLNGGFDIADAGNNFVISSNITGSSGLTKRGAGALTLAGSNNYSGTTYIYDGTLNMTGTNIWTGAGNADFYQVHSNAVLNISGYFYSGGQFRVGYESGTTATVNQTDGLFIGAGTYGQLIGNTAGANVGIYNLYGGTISNATASRLVLGVNNNNTGIFNLYGGTLLAPVVEIGRNSGSAVFTTNLFTQAGGVATIGTLYMGGLTSTYTNQLSTLLISNGVFSVNSFASFAPSANDSATFYMGTGAVVTLPAFPVLRGSNSITTVTFDGGTLIPAGSSSTYLQSMTATYITSNGLNINVGAPIGITISQNLENAAAQVGSLTKLGNGTLTLAGTNTYGGNTLIQAGTLSVASGYALPGWDVASRYTVATGAGLAVGNAFSDANIATLLGTGNFAVGSRFGFDTTDANRTYDLTIADLPAGTMGLVKVGANALTLTAANTYSGGTLLGGGTLVLSNDAALGTSGDITFAGGTLQYGLGFNTDLNARFKNSTGAITLDDNGQTISLAGIMDASNTGGLTKLGGGTLTLNGVNTFSGTTTISNGVLQLGIPDALPNIAAVAVAGGIYDLNGFTTVTNGAVSMTSGAISNGTLVGASYNFSGGTAAANLSGAGALTNTANTTVLTGVNTYTGGTALKGGTLSIGDYANLPTAGGLNFVGGNLQITGNSITNLDAYTINWDTFSGGLNIASNSSFIIANNLGAGSTLTNYGKGFLVLTGTSAGSVVAGGSGGALVLSNTSGGVAISGDLQIGTASSDCYVRSGADEQIADTSVVSFGSTSYGRWLLLGHTETVGGLNDVGGHGVIENNDNIASWPSLPGDNTGTATLIVSNSGNYTYAGYLRDYGTSAGGKLRLIKDGVGAQTLAGNLIQYTLPTLVKNGALILSNTTAFASDVTITGGKLLLSTPTALNNKSITNQVVNGLGFLSTNAFTIGGLNGSGSVALTNDAGAAVTLTLGGNNTSGNFLGTLNGVGSVVKTGTGTQILFNANSYSGGTLINGGYLVVNNNDALGTGNVTLTNATLRLTISDGITLTNALIIYANTGVSTRGLIENSGASNATVSGPITINGGVVNGGHFASTGGGTLTIAGAITSSVQVVNRLGTVIYSGGGAYADFGLGGTAKLGANDGLATNAVIQMGLSSTAIFDLNGFNQTLAGIRESTQTRTITNSVGATQAVLTLSNANPTNFVYSGTLAGNLALTMNGVFTQTLVGATNRYTGPTTINGGVLALSNTSAYVSPTTINGGQLLLLSANAAQLAVITNNVTDGGLGFAANSTAYSLGGLAGAGNVALTNFAGAAVALTISNTANLLYSGALSQGGSLIKLGTGTLQLTGANTYGGGTLVNGGVLQLSATTALPSIGILTNNATVALDFLGAQTAVDRIASVSTGTVALLTSTAGETINFNTGSLSNSFLGAIGNVNYLGSFTPYGSTYRLGGGGGTLTYQGVIGGASNLVIGGLGGGTVVLANANTYSGTTLISGATLRLGIANALPTNGVLTLGSGATAGTLDLSDYSQTLGRLLVQSASATATNMITIGTGQTLTLNGGFTNGNQVTGTSVLTVQGGGTWNINSGGKSVQLAASTSTTSPNSSTVNMGALGTFTANLGSGTLRLAENLSGGSSGTANNLLVLATNSSITASVLGIGDKSYATIGTNILSLGAGLTALNVDSIFVSGGKSSGLINFAGPTGMLTISNSTGTGRADLNIGFINAGTGANQTGIFDTRGHEADLFLGNVVCGERSSGSGGSGISGGYLFFNQGTMDITNLIIGLRVTTLSSNVIGEVHISGGTVNLKSTMLASNSASGASVTALLDLSGGLITMSDNITKGGGVGSATATLLMTGNAVLDMSGKYIGTAANPIDTLTFQSGTLKNVGDINGGAGLAKTGSGSLILAGNNTYGGGTTINGGTLQLGNDNALPNGSDLFVSSSGSFDLAAFGQTVGNLTGTGAVTNSAGAGLGALTVSAGDFSGAISGANSLTKIGAGALTLSGQSTYSGDTTINNGTLKMGADLALPSTTQLKADVLGSTLDLAGYSQQIRSLDTFAGTIANSAVSRSTLTVQFGEGTQNFLGQVTGASTLTLTGGGTLQVSNSASFGPFTASIVTNNSVLIMNGTHSGLVTTYSNSWVGGSGTITTLTNMVGGLYAPGATLGLGSQTIHNLTLTPGSLLAVGLAASSNGLARVDTTFVASNALLRLDLTHYTFTPNQIYVVMDYSGTSFSVTDQSQLFTLQDFGPSAQASILLTNNMTFAVSGGLSTTNFFQINYDTLANGLPGSQITLTAVPEPGTASLLGLVGVAWLIRRIRRKKNI